MVTVAAQTISSLLQQTRLDDHEEVLKAANNVIKKSKNDTDAHHIRLIALLKLDRYDDALRVLEEGGDALKKQARLEWAYTLYKGGQLEKAEQSAKEGNGARGLKHVEAQAAYRSESFYRAAELYQELASQKTVHDSDSDLRINGGATDAQLTWAGQAHLVKKTKPDREALEQFETAYNAACGYIARGELKQAELLLSRARDLCLAADEISDEDKQAELLPIMVQQVCVLCRRGKREQAKLLSSSIDVSKIYDVATRHIAQSNYLKASVEPINPYLSYRLFHSNANIPTTDAPFHYQSSILRQNSMALDLQAGKYNGVAASTRSQVSGKPHDLSGEVGSAGAFNAAAHARNQIGKAAIQEMLPLLEKRPSDVGLLLTIVQLYVSTNNANTATLLLESFFDRLESSTATADQDVRFAPGLVAVLISLYTQQGRMTHTKAEFVKAATYWRHKSKKTCSSNSLLKAAGTALCDSATSEELQASHDIFSIVYQQDRTDIVAISGLIASSPTSTPRPPTELLNKLPSINKLVTNISASDLEASGIAQPSSTKPITETVSTASRKRTAAAYDSAEPRKLKKIRKSRLPKDYDPAKRPDPERWLPLRDRSNWRPKGKKKGKGMAGGMQTQGGIASEEGSGTSTPSLQVQLKAGGSAGGSGGVAKAKKKKGKK